ncbi:Cloroperoxidase [Aaosphaeria arxii CBS 175.79]|uniref:Cloroperoxidase n=1 Tax=Aaosphaeria arxii CBS 175.79 TaxID=1450172 RepID=A0A6A5YA53_9PLEO|nr:Cloroperoxidase [Aaosphaeria arxii CBS 175.79]KAF2022318.1 Cloroperoxidase [Aaosphaeria arxii CBS 175.79]
MRLSLAVVSLAAVVKATVDFGNWHPPAYGDVRSPCPALNALANHNILPHDGKNLTVPIFVKALTEALNFSVEVATIVSSAALQTVPQGSTTLNLDDLSKHNIIEHDGSLSRQDFNISGDATTFNSGIFDEFVGYFGGAQDVSLPVAAAGRWGRINSAKAKNPAFSYTASQRFSSYLESAIYSLVLAAPKKQAVPLAWLNALFKEERFPYNEGWRTPQSPTNAASLASTILILSLATPEDLTFGSAPPSGFHGEGLVFDELK